MNAGLFLAIMAFTVWFVFKDEDLHSVMTAMRQMSVGGLLISVLIALFFVGAEGVMIWYLLRGIGGTSSLSSCICCSFIGFFFSGITPSATGGQPMQLYYLKKDGNSWSLSSVVLMTVALMYKLVIVLFGIGILIFWHEPLKGYLGRGYYQLFLLGLALNTMLVAGLLMVMFTPGVIRLMIDKLEWLAVKLHIIKKAGSKNARLDHFMNSYQGALVFLREHKSKMAVVFLATVLQRAAVFSLTYVVYRGMGNSGVRLTTVMWLQASVYLAVDMLPVPGAQGITEAMYRRAFSRIFAGQGLTASMCISRGVSFYLMIVVGLIVTIYQFFWKTKNKNR